VLQVPADRRYKPALVQVKPWVYGMLGVMSETALQALAEPRRREILRLVRDQPRSVNEIAEQFDITQQAVSQHLRVLKEAGLVAMRPQGQRRLYVVRPEGLAALRDFLADFWPQSLQRLKHAAEADDGG
jgi:DNA-binding transcriptional ArsR family regulator